MKKLNSATLAAMKSPWSRSGWRRSAPRSLPMTRHAGIPARLVKSEIEKWAGPIKASGATAD